LGGKVKFFFVPNMPNKKKEKGSEVSRKLFRKVNSTVEILE
jgi:hypothetical protein